MNKNQPIFEQDLENGIISCILSDGKNIYTGTAKCHPDDKDMISEKTGCEIAFRRAKIKALRQYRDELKIRLSTLNQLYYSMNMSYRFNEKSYENKMLQRQIRMIQFDLDTTKEIIIEEQQKLKTYIIEKDKFYQKIRANRQKGNNN